MVTLSSKKTGKTRELMEKKSSTSGEKKKLLSEKKSKPAKKSSTSPKKKQFIQNKIADPSQNSKKEKHTPIWIIIIFLFSLAFFLFSLYKVVYQETYHRNEVRGNLPVFSSEEITTDGENQEAPLDVQEEDTQQGTKNSSSEPINQQEFPLKEDILLIQTFYQNLVDRELEKMNDLVHLPLKNTQTRNNHWNKKNIKIFTKHLENNLEIQDIFLIPGSVNQEKKTRKYSYTLKYTIKPNQSFLEEWNITLFSVGDKVLISEIMCTTEGCSRSPFFRPQNYNLK